MGYPPVYLVHSFGEFDGGTRSLPQGTRLMFGPTWQLADMKPEQASRLVEASLAKMATCA
jgi:hypothetical protein